MNAEGIERAVRRMAREIADRARERGGELAIVGIRRGGVHLAERIRRELAAATGKEPPIGTLDIALYRDDLSGGAPAPVVGPTDIQFPVTGKTIVLVDDVLYTGRTARAAMDALLELGRPAAVRLAILVDRGHRELPIRADYVGKNVPTARGERVLVNLEETDGEDGVIVVGD